MNAPLTSRPLPPCKHTRLFPLRPDATPSRKLTVSGLANFGVRVEKILGRDMLVIEREVPRRWRLGG